MYYSEKAQQLLEDLAYAADNGTLAPIAARVLLRTGDRPVDRLSFLNRLTTALAGGVDVRTYNQWKALGRQVKKGEKAITHLLRPCLKKVEEVGPNGEPSERQVLTGYATYAVFDITQTEGDPVDEGDIEYLETLPLREVADRWGIKVVLGGTTSAGAYYFERDEIRLKVASRTTWLHELAHAADQRILLAQGRKLTSLREDPVAYAQAEQVAQLSAEILAGVLGLEGDQGFTLGYLESWGGLDAARTIIGRVGQVVDLIVQEARNV